MITSKLQEAFQFFREHAGYCTPPGLAACALRLARAEQWGEERGIEVTWEEEQDRYEDVWGEPAPEGCDVLFAFVKHEGHVLASLGMITLKAPSFMGGVSRDPYVRVVNAELFAEARARLEEIEAAEAAAAKDAHQKDDALRIVRRLAAWYRDPHDDINGGDFVEEVGTLLDDAGFVAESRIAFIVAHRFKVEHEGDAYTVTGPGDYQVSGDKAVLGQVIAEHDWSEDDSDEDDTDGGDPEMGGRVAHAFIAADLGPSEDCDHRDPEPVFEHGRWWINCSGCGGQWAVHNMVGGDSVDGFTFERTTVGVS